MRFLKMSNMDQKETQKVLGLLLTMQNLNDIGFFFTRNGISFTEWSDDACYSYSLSDESDEECKFLTIEDVEMKIATRLNAIYYAERIENARQAI